MTEEQLKKWLIDKFNLCYKVKHNELDNSIFWYYDESYIRKLKICKINNQNISSHKKVNGICLFEQDIKSNRLYCDDDNIWTFFEENYKDNYYDVKFCIQNIIKDINELKTYTPWIRTAHYAFEIEEPDNLKILI